MSDAADGPLTESERNLLSVTRSLITAVIAMRDVLMPMIEANAVPSEFVESLRAGLETAEAALRDAKAAADKLRQDDD